MMMTYPLVMRAQSRKFLQNSSC